MSSSTNPSSTETTTDQPFPASSSTNNPRGYPPITVSKKILNYPPIDIDDLVRRIDEIVGQYDQIFFSISTVKEYNFFERNPSIELPAASLTSLQSNHITTVSGLLRSLYNVLHEHQLNNFHQQDPFAASKIPAPPSHAKQSSAISSSSSSTSLLKDPSPLLLQKRIFLLQEYLVNEIERCEKQEETIKQLRNQLKEPQPTLASPPEAKQLKTKPSRLRQHHQLAPPPRIQPPQPLEETRDTKAKTNSSISGVQPMTKVQATTKETVNTSLFLKIPPLSPSDSPPTTQTSSTTLSSESVHAALDYDDEVVIEIEKPQRHASSFSFSSSAPVAKQSPSTEQKQINNLDSLSSLAVSQTSTVHQPSQAQSSSGRAAKATDTPAAVAAALPSLRNKEEVKKLQQHSNVAETKNNSASEKSHNNSSKSTNATNSSKKRTKRKRKQSSPPKSRDELRQYLGKYVKRYFDAGWFYGLVSRYRHPFFLIVYEDFDLQEYTCEDIETYRCESDEIEAIRKENCLHYAQLSGYLEDDIPDPIDARTDDEEGEVALGDDSLSVAIEAIVSQRTQNYSDSGRNSSSRSPPPHSPLMILPSLTKTNQGKSQRAISATSSDYSEDEADEDQIFSSNKKQKTLPSSSSSSSSSSLTNHLESRSIAITGKPNSSKSTSRATIRNQIQSKSPSSAISSPRLRNAENTGRDSPITTPTTAVEKNHMTSSSSSFSSASANGLTEENVQHIKEKYSSPDAATSEIAEKSSVDSEQFIQKKRIRKSHGQLSQRIFEEEEDHDHGFAEDEFDQNEAPLKISRRSVPKKPLPAPSLPSSNTNSSVSTPVRVEPIIQIPNLSEDDDDDDIIPMESPEPFTQAILNPTAEIQRKNNLVDLTQS